MLRALFASVILGICTLLTLSAQESVNATEIYPLAIGHKWTYRIVGQEDRFVVTVKSKEKVGNQMCFRVEASIKDKVLAVEQVAIKGNGVYRYKMDEDELVPPILLIKNPSKQNETWKQDYKLGKKAASVTLHSSFEGVTVPAGKYLALVINCDVTEGDTKAKTTLWFAPKVGLVKQTYEVGKNILTLELEKFEPAGK
ncbi:MAG: hypothetical protein N2112_14645 [Gemmataceae bacterium]|jgi:hypothetical protein|nr:hypothetical protein [Gemmataceae bacterium]